MKMRRVHARLFSRPFSFQVFSDIHHILQVITAFSMADLVGGEPQDGDG